MRAVRRVLYERGRMRRLHIHLASIDELMNLDPGNALQPDDPRVQGGSGPLWYIPANGQLSVAVVEAAARCEKIADILRATRRELADVDFRGADKRVLRSALAEQADAWTERAKVWRAPGRPQVQLAVARIAQHEKRSVEQLKKVSEYLKEVDPKDVR